MMRRPHDPIRSRGLARSTPGAFLMLAAVVIPSVNPARSRNGEALTFRIRVQDKQAISLPTVELPDFKDWKVLNQFPVNVGTEVFFINGQTSYRKNYDFSYILKPLRAGTLTIPSVKVIVDGKALATESLEVPVDAIGGPLTNPPPLAQRLPMPIPRGMLPPPSGDSHIGNTRETFFIRAEAQKTNVYVGEQILLSYDLYQAGNAISNVEFQKFPSFQGFLKEELLQNKSLSWRPMDRGFLKAELIRYVLFPLKAGDLTLESFQLKADLMSIQRPQSDEDMMNNFFRPFGGAMQVIPQVKVTPPVKFHVKPLPPAPDATRFTGGVGQFQMELKGPQGKLSVDQPFTITLTLAGRGNFMSIAQAPIKLPANMESYDTKGAHHFEQDGSGYKTFEYLVLPRQPGNFTLDPIEWTYFDPAKAQYLTLKSQPLTLNVEGSASTAPVAAAGAGVAPPETFAPVRTGPQPWVAAGSDGRSWLGGRLAWIAQGAAYLALILLFVRRRALDTEEAFLRRQPWLRTARKIRGRKRWNPVELANLVDQWTREKLCHQWSGQGLHTESAREEFSNTIASVLPPEKHNALRGLQELWTELDQIRFAGRKEQQALAPDELFNRAQGLLEALERKSL